MGIAAVNTGNNLVYLIEAAMLSFMIISGIIGKKNLDRLEIKVRFPDEIFANVDFPIEYKVKNNKRLLPSFLLILNFEGKKILIPFIEAGKEYAVTTHYRFTKRGMLEIKNLSICSVFPFDFFVRCVVYTESIPVTVYPYPKRCNILQESVEIKKGKSLEDGKRVGLYGELISVRDYAKGDSIKWIHWKASAKTGKLKTKEFSDLGGEPVVVNLDQIKGSLEERISCATYLILELYKRNIPFGLKYEKKLIKPEHSKKQKVRILRMLAQI